GEQGWNLPFLALDNAYLELIKSDKKALAELLQKVEAGGLPVRKIIVRGEPLSAIREAIARERIDLLVVPAHEESRFEHFLFGHLNEDILRTLPCSILFVKDETAA
ncbi:MAG TPA: universal stress protein, partial [Candidatus Deferrimicrobiaceae bacterium]